MSSMSVEYQDPKPFNQAIAWSQAQDEKLGGKDLTVRFTFIQKVAEDFGNFLAILRNFA